MNKYYLKVSSFVALFAMCVALLPANAAGLDSTYGTSTDGEIDTTETGADGYATATVAWTTSHAYPAESDVTLTVLWSDTDVRNFGNQASSTDLLGCVTTTQFGLQDYDYTSLAKDTAVFQVETQVPGATAVEACVRVPVQQAGGDLYQGNFSLAFITTEPGNTTSDFGIIEYYVGGGNDVTVTGNVQPTLEFAITQPGDIAVELTNHICDLGSMTTAAEATCSYRLKISTNAALGFTVNVNTNGGLSNQGYATITDCTDGTLIASQPTVEAYGIGVDGADVGGYNSSTQLYNEPILEEGSFATDDTPITTYTQPLFVSYTEGFSGTDTASTSLVEHRAQVTAATPAGIYTQLVTYTITPDF
jgi:hypothetical protein